MRQKMPRPIYFKGNEYHTSESTPEFWGYKILGPWFFILRCFLIIVYYRRIALKKKYDTEAWAASSYDILKVIEGCGGRLHLSGLDNISLANGPVVFVSNHMSTLETMVFPSIISPLKEATFVVKDSLVKNFIFGPVISARDPIVVGRVDSRADYNKVMKEGLDLLNKGTSVIIFPEGTRKAQFIPEEFNSIGVKLAKAAKVQIIPIAIKTDFWGNGKNADLLDRSKPIYMHFSPPLSVESSGKEEHKSIVDFINSKLKQWKD